MQEVYLDNAATTPTDPQVVKVISEQLSDNWGNASSLHGYGRKARAKLDEVRHVIANSINAKDDEIIFTSGGTESNNMALIEAAKANKKYGNKIITTKIEHQSVRQPLAYLTELGYEVVELDVNEAGVIDLNDFKKELDDNTILVSIMMANNEVGSIMPIKEIGELLVNHHALLHTDAVQAFGLLEIDVKAMHIDLLSTSAHKLNGPKMTGFLYKNEDVHLDSLLRGGEQEDKQRAGTENIANLMGFKKAVELANSSKKSELQDRYYEFKQQIMNRLNDEDIDFEVNGGVRKRQVQHVFNIWLKGFSTYVMQTNLDLEGIAISGGSACTAGSLEPSHVLTAMYGEDSPRISESIRISFGKQTTADDVDYFCDKLIKIINRLKK